MFNRSEHINHFWITTTHYESFWQFIIIMYDFESIESLWVIMNNFDNLLLLCMIMNQFWVILNNFEYFLYYESFLSHYESLFVVIFGSLQQTDLSSNQVNTQTLTDWLFMTNRVCLIYWFMTRFIFQFCLWFSVSCLLFFQSSVWMSGFFQKSHYSYLLIWIFIAVNSGDKSLNSCHVFLD